MTVTMTDLQPGDLGRVLGFAKGNAGYRQKLLSMGLTPGTEFAVVRVAPLGDPVEIKVRGFALSIRKDEAAVLRIEKSPPVWDQ